MPGDMIEVVQHCSVCGSEVGNFSDKKENLMLSKVDSIWCDTCKKETLAVRDIAGRMDRIAREIESYPRSLPAAFER